MLMLDWSRYREQLLKAIGELWRLSPQTVPGYRELSDAGTKTARLDPKTHGLIALAVGVNANATAASRHMSMPPARTERRVKQIAEA
jgi:hypothetical protein